MTDLSPSTFPTAPATAFVTGGSVRIGRAITTRLASSGWKVALHYNRSADTAEALVAELRAAGCEVVALHADLADEQATAGLIPAAEAALGPVQLLVNNASVFEKDDLPTHSRESWDRHMAVNLRAPAVLIQAMAQRFAAGVLAEESDGLVVNLLDQRVWNLTPEFMSYTLSKSALWTLTRTLALSLAPRIRVNGIGPGPTLRNVRQSEEDFAAQYQAVPLGRSTDPALIADAVEFLWKNRAMTGQMLALDGGEHLGWAQPDWGLVPRE